MATMSGKWSIKGGSKRFTFKPMANWPKKSTVKSDGEMAPSKEIKNRETKITKPRHIRAVGRPNTPTGAKVASQSRGTTASPSHLKSTAKGRTVATSKPAAKYVRLAHTPKPKMPPLHPNANPTLGKQA